ncbi:MAG: T9SS type A sorting domain-containing protein [Bacteroidetes bacterium]|nr:T9SS type A sorting domain-containing protein [Bacteroidota bacterium]
MKKQLLSIFAIASLAMTASAQQFIPNAGFETWGQAAGEEIQPTGWVSYNVFTAPLMDPLNTNSASVTQAGTPNNFQGTYSAKITTIDLVTNPASANLPNRGGFLMAGSVAINAPYIFAGYQFSSRPTAFTYAAKYAPSGIDTAYCLVQLTHWNSILHHRDTVAVGFDYLPLAVSNYQVRNMSIIYNTLFSAVFPDTATIFFSASSNITPQAGSALYVDALGFSGYDGISDNSLNNGVDVYPNPSSTITNFDVVSDNAFEVVVYDMTGREVNRLRINNKNAKLNSYTMAKGVYTYSIITKDNEVLTRGKFAVAQ